MRLPSLLLLSAVLSWSAPASDPIRVQVDLRDAYRKLIHSEEDLPVKPGPTTLLFAKWLPGEHSPTGPIDNLAGLVITGNGQPIRWQHDDVDMFAFHLNVPRNVNRLHVQLDFLATAPSSGFSAGASTSPSLAVLSWNTVVLYPAGLPADQIQVAPAIQIPDDWKLGTALVPASVTSSRTQFEPVSLQTLIDSPVLAGRFFREVPLAPETNPKHFLDLAADGPEDLNISNDQIAAYSNLVREAGALFGSHHYRSYHFLLTLSDSVAHFGLEHHESSDDRAPARTLIDDDLCLTDGDLLPHEFTHSWNGKYRRPAGLLSPDYQTPMKGDLLWIYEGFTQYIGDVLAARSGVWTKDQYRAYLATSAAQLDHRPGRTWRDLQDTATSVQILSDTPDDWDNWRRSLDYYAEGELLWLEVDSLIRQQSKGARSIDDFCRRFYGPQGTSLPAVKPYELKDVVLALNTVQRYDWEAFFEEHLQSLAPRAPLRGLGGAGYELVYNDSANDFERAHDNAERSVTAWYSLGINTKEGAISDVLFDSPAFKAGLGPGMKLVAVNGRSANDEELKRAIHKTADPGSGTTSLIVENNGYYKVVDLAYAGGERYPHLHKISGENDTILDRILAPRVPVSSAESSKAPQQTP